LQPFTFAAASAVLLGIHLMLVVREWGMRRSRQGDGARRDGTIDVVWTALPGLLIFVLLLYTARGA